MTIDPELPKCDHPPNENVWCRMDWTLVRSFLATVETGSLSAAARGLGLTQPTIGRHIQELEQDLGVTLFARSQRGLEPTEAALDLVDAARAMRDQAEAFERIATGRAETVAGTVRITASEMVATHVLPEVLRPMRIAHPEIQFEIEATSTVGNLMRRDADVAIRMLRPTQPDLVARRVNSMAIGLFASEDYLARRGRPRTTDELLAHDLVGLDRDDSVIRGFAAAGVSVERTAFAVRADDHAVGWAMVQAGLGLGFGPVWVGRRTPGLVRIDLPIRLPMLEMWLAAHQDLTTSRRMRLVVDALAEGLAALPLAG
jgi:DNA-binding transcriptional LysR family regulator